MVFFFLVWMHLGILMNIMKGTSGQHKAVFSYLEA